MRIIGSAVRFWSAALASALLLAVVATACSSGTLLEAETSTEPVAPAETTPAQTTPAQTTPAETTPAETTAAPFRYSDLDTITLDELPAEALDTLRLIRSDGPYPYRQDGSTFQNREGILPDRPRGHYREFTVDTPGLDHRGARRFVTGDDGEIYYTEDHYQSFRELVSQ